MLNKENEQIRSEMLELTINGHSIAKVNGKLCACLASICHQCDFQPQKNDSTPCGISFRDWANSEYLEPVDWSKVEDKTQLFVRQDEEDDWQIRYFAFTKNGKVICYSIGDKDSELPMYKTWKYARLTDPYVEEKGGKRC